MLFGVKLLHESDTDSTQGTGAHAPIFTNDWARGTESKKNKKQESDQTVLDTRKRLPKRLIVLVKPKKWRGRTKKFPALRA